MPISLVCSPPFLNVGPLQWSRVSQDGRPTIWSMATSVKTRRQRSRCCREVEQTRRPQKEDERPLASGCETYTLIYWIRRPGGKTFWPTLAPSMQLFIVRHFLDSMMEMTTVLETHNLDTYRRPTCVCKDTFTFFQSWQLRPTSLRPTPVTFGVESDPNSFLEIDCRTQRATGVRDCCARITIYGNVRCVVSHFVGPCKIEI